MATNKQKAQIHILKDELGLTEDEYRAMLAGYGVSSSADDDFTIRKAADFINILRREKAARENVGAGGYHGWGKNKYEYLRPRPANMADPKQLRKIEAMWRDLADNPSDAALERFLYRQTGIKNIVWLEKPHAKAVLVAEEEMKNYKPKKEKG